MKNRIIPILVAAMALTAVAWSAIAISTEEPSTAEKTKSHDRMVSKQADIIKRLGMSAPMEIPAAGETDFVTTAVEEGWIIEATLEEAEAALKAAAATPSNEDDIAAMRLVHRGSYRYFLDAKISTETPVTSN